MKTGDNSKRLLILGIAGCLLYVVGDFLFAATGKYQTTDSIGLMVRVAYLDMGTWRMVASILCGFIGTFLYYMGFHRMHALLKRHIAAPEGQKWVRLFRVAYVTGTVSWAYVHAMFMNVALVFKFVVQGYGDMQAAADIANRVFYANAAPMLIAFLLCDGVFTVVMPVLIWKKYLPLKGTGTRVLATLCGPLFCAGIIGNLFTLLPWPLNQLDHGTESLGHALILVLGLVLLKHMQKAGELEG